MNTSSGAEGELTERKTDGQTGENPERGHPELRACNDGGEYFDHTRDEMLKYLPVTARRVLDVGCASGAFGAAVKAKLGAEVWGIEVNEQVAAQASSRLDRVLVGDVMLLVGQVPVRSFDCIVCNDVLEHLVDPFSAVRRLRELLTPGGRLVASIPNLRFYPVLHDLILHGEFQYQEWGVLDRTHLRFFTEKSIRRMFQDAGYVIESVEGINPIRVRKLEVLNLMLFGRLSDCRYLQLVCVARSD